MDPQTLWNLLLSGGMAALGWFARTQYDAVQAVKSDLADHKVVVARDYATNHDVASIDGKLDRMNDKLDRLIERQ